MRAADGSVLPGDSQLLGDTLEFQILLIVIYVVTALVATLTTFFGPAEAAMIPMVVKREQLLTANSFFILMLQASFVLGFALLGPAAHRFLGIDLGSLNGLPYQRVYVLISATEF